MRQIIKHELPKLKTVTKDGMRYYQITDDKFYPSVTSVLKEDEVKKKAIHAWRKRVGAAEANRIAKKASTRGTTIHSLCEKYLLGEDLKFDNPVNQESFLMIKPEIDKIGDIHSIEQTLYSDHLRVGGRLDVAGEYNNYMSIIDFKTANKAKKREHIEDYFMQTAAYAVAFEERTGIPCSRLVLIISVDQSSPIVFVEKRDTWVKPFIELRHKFQVNWGM